MSGIRYQSATDLASDVIRNRIYDNIYAPGTKLNLDEIAADMGLSRTPVRDASARLRNEGLVTVVPRVGIFVRTIALQEVLEVYSAKESLEPLMARWATERATAARRHAFRKSADGLVELAGRADVDAYLNLVVERRLEMLDMSESVVFADIFRSIDSRVRLLRARNLSQAERMRSSVREHMAIAKAVDAGEAELAFAQTQAHVRSARESLIALLARDAPH
jgi:GntR family transcriptional regulator, rspAB operon transcriptional repressor